jgi:hypothetical protein
MIIKQIFRYLVLYEDFCKRVHERLFNTETQAKEFIDQLKANKQFFIRLEVTTGLTLIVMP